MDVWHKKEGKYTDVTINQVEEEHFMCKEDTACSIEMTTTQMSCLIVVVVGMVILESVVGRQCVPLLLGVGGMGHILWHSPVSQITSSW